MNTETLRKIYADKKDKILFGALLFLGICALFVPTFKGGTPAKAAESPFEADTVIPHGFVLVPIELENQRSLDSIVGAYAIVNLYRGSQLSEAKGKLVGRHLRLMRAPMNPDQFAVLVPEEDVSQFAIPTARFYAVVENRHIQERASVTRQSKARSRVEYFSGGSR